MSFKKFNKTFCTLGLAALYTFTTYGATVTDVTSAHWAYAAIVNLEGKGIMSLNSSGQFFPNQMMDYFEVSDVLAKAAGYVDGDMSKNADPTLIASIAANYEKQKPILQSYVSKYKTWNSAYNQQIAYLLGKGCLTQRDLDKFITKSETSEIKNVVTKEELSIYIVRMMGKAVTATQKYTTTGFKDESNISEEARPYMAYLKNIGLLTSDAAGNGNGKFKVTKALCAKMVDSALAIKENTSANTGTAANTGTTNNSNTKTGVVKRVMTKNTTEYFVLLQTGSDMTYYTIKNTTKILDANGSEAAITKLSGETVTVTLAMEGNTEYITSIKIVAAGTGTNDNTTDDPAGNTNAASDAVTETTKISGTLAQTITNGVCRVSLSDGTVQTYVLDNVCSVTLDGRNVQSEEIAEGDTVILTADKGVIKSLQATSGSNTQLTNGEVVGKKLSSNSYILMLKQNGREAAVTIPDEAVITRNFKEVNMTDIRMGDTINLTKTNGTVTSVQATSAKTKVQGTISQLIIGQTTQVVISVNKVPTTYTLAQDAEVFDISKNEVITPRDLHLGQKATLLLDSKEVISLDVDSTADSVNLMGTIVKVGKRSSYIDVLVDYDYLSNESKVYKRIELSNDVKVAINGRSKDIYDLEPDMNIVISYNYLDDITPQKILVVE